MNEIKLIKQENSDCKKKILVVGVFHGDEFQGEFFINSYLKKFPNAGKNALWFIPRLNKSKVRKNPNGVDLNRNFPTKNWVQNEKTSDYYSGDFKNSEAEVQFMVNLIENNNFSAILTIHSPYKVVNFDGPAEYIAQEISKITGYKVTSDIGYPTPGSFGTWAGKERNIPTITLEIDEEEDIEKLNLKMEKVFEWLKNDF